MAKICIVCGEDCSTRPRVKNPRGEYACRVCADTAASKGVVSPQSPSGGGEDDLLADLIGDAVDHMGDACPTCGVVLPQDAVICTHCGLNIQVGKQIKTRITADKAPKEKKADRGYSGGGLAENAGKIHAGAAVLVVALGAVSLQTWMPALLIATIMGAVVYFWTMFNAFGNDSLGYAWCSVIGIFIPIVGIANLIYGIFITDNATLRWAYVSWLLAQLALIGLLVVHGFDEFTKAMGAG